VRNRVNIRSIGRRNLGGRGRTGRCGYFGDVSNRLLFLANCYPSKRNSPSVDCGLTSRAARSAARSVSVRARSRQNAPAAKSSSAGARFCQTPQIPTFVPTSALRAGLSTCVMNGPFPPHELAEFGLREERFLDAGLTAQGGASSS
jgi:hypothetical protein